MRISNDSMVATYENASCSELFRPLTPADLWLCTGGRPSKRIRSRSTLHAPPDLWYRLETSCVHTCPISAASCNADQLDSAPCLIATSKSQAFVSCPWEVLPLHSEDSNRNQGPGCVGACTSEATRCTHQFVNSKLRSCVFVTK